MVKEESAIDEQRKGGTSKKRAREMEKVAEEDSFITQDLLNETAIKVAPPKGPRKCYKFPLQP